MRFEKVLLLYLLIISALLHPALISELLLVPIDL